MDELKIERAARGLHRAVWRWHEASEKAVDLDVTDYVDPRVACEALGIQYCEYPEFDNRFAQAGEVVAGVLDRQRGVIAVATNASPASIRFTAAHEIGHWVLHPNAVMHRDRPIKTNFRNPTGRPKIEREADYFAACFLMPWKSVVNEFQRRFGTSSPVLIDEEVAFWLDPVNGNRLLGMDSSSFDKALAFARAQQFYGRAFSSMADRFKVSQEAMAIRIHELGLIG